MYAEQVSNRQYSKCFYKWKFVLFAHPLPLADTSLCELVVVVYTTYK